MSGKEQLVKMINQIAANVPGQQDAEKAIEGTYIHVSKFWSRSMKEDVLEIAAVDSTVFNTTASAAIRRLAEDP